MYEREYAKLVASGLGESYYAFQYVIEATLSMFEATRERIYLERALAWSEVMVSKANVLDDNGNWNWRGGWKPAFAPAPIAYQLEDFQGSTGLARLCQIVLKDAELTTAYGRRVAGIFQFVKNDIVDKHLYRRGSEKYLLAGARDRGKVLDDKVVLLIRCMLPIYSLGVSGYRETIYDLASGFRSRLTPYKGGLIWDRGLGYGMDSALDTSHANRYPDAALDLYKAGVAFSLEDIKGMAALFTKVIWNQSLEDPRFANFIDGSNGRYRGYQPWAGGLIYFGWVKLGEMDSRVQQVAAATLTAMVDGKRNPSIDSMNSIYGRLALTGHLARNASVQPMSR